MPHQILSTKNDYERKINYDWPYCRFIFEDIPGHYDLS